VHNVFAGHGCYIQQTSSLLTQSFTALLLHSEVRIRLGFMLIYTIHMAV